MRRRQALFLGGFALAATAVPALLGSAARAAGSEASQFEIESDLTCQCGCGLTVHSCNHLNCSSSIPLKREVAEQIATGRSREEILQYFQTKYGEKILSSPTAHGFNLAAWTVPFIALGIGGALVALILARWRRASAHLEATSGAPAGDAASATARARLEAALHDFDKRS